MENASLESEISPGKDAENPMPDSAHTSTPDADPSHAPHPKYDLLSTIDLHGTTPAPGQYVPSPTKANDSETREEEKEDEELPPAQEHGAGRVASTPYTIEVSTSAQEIPPSLQPIDTLLSAEDLSFQIVLPAPTAFGTLPLEDAETASGISTNSIGTLSSPSTLPYLGPSTMKSPLLPWEVLERIMGHSATSDDRRRYPIKNTNDYRRRYYHRKTLCSFSLTCRDLHPRALCLLVADAHFKCRDDIFDFCDFVVAKPHLKRFVRSITVDPNDFAPVPILNTLPKLSELSFTGTINVISLVLNRSTLICFKLSTHYIQVLHLSRVSFPTYLDFARLLLAFTNLMYLSSFKVEIKAEGHPTALEVLKRRLSRQLCPRTISVDYHGEENTPDPSVMAFLLDSGSELVPSTVETLTITCTNAYIYTFLRSFDWPRLRTLILHIDLEGQYSTREGEAFFDGLCSWLEIFSGSSNIHDIALAFDNFLVSDLSWVLVVESSPERTGKLEQALLRFPIPQMTCYLSYSVRESTKSLWTQELAKCFPILFQRRAVTLAASVTVVSEGRHDDSITDIATSPDSKWVATASRDCMVILWNASDGSMVKQCVAHSYRPITSLAFSPDSQHLASGGEDKKTKVWDLAGGSFELVATLEGHTADVKNCAWSPRGDILASRSRDGTIRLSSWNKHRDFHELHVLAHPDPDDMQRIMFSADGRWLISPSSEEHHIWDVTTGKLHNSVSVDRQLFRVPGAEFYLPSRKKGAEEVGLVDVETGTQLAVLKGLPKNSHGVFSPDGTMVLTWADDGMMKLWDGHTGAELFSLEGHKMEVTRALFSPHGKYVASASKDVTVRLWRTGDGSLMETFSEHHDSESDEPWRSAVLHVAFTPDGKTLWSGDRSGLVIMREVRDDVEIEE